MGGGWLVGSSARGAVEQDIYIIIRVGTSWNTGNYTFRSHSDIISRIPFSRRGEERFASSSSSPDATPSSSSSFPCSSSAGYVWGEREGVVAVPEKCVYYSKHRALVKYVASSFSSATTVI